MFVDFPLNSVSIGGRVRLFNPLLTCQKSLAKLQVPRRSSRQLCRRRGVLESQQMCTSSVGDRKPHDQGTLSKLSI